MNKAFLASACGVVGGAISYLMGGIDKLLISIIILMAIDFTLGLISGFFKKSKKTKNGGLSSNQCVKGIFKKVSMLLLIIVGVVLDKATNSDFFRNSFIISLIANETISIIENLAIIGIPMPKTINKALEILNEREETNK